MQPAVLIRPRTTNQPAPMGVSPGELRTRANFDTMAAHITRLLPSASIELGMIRARKRSCDRSDDRSPVVWFKLIFSLATAPDALCRSGHASAELARMRAGNRCSATTCASLPLRSSGWLRSEGSGAADHLLPRARLPTLGPLSRPPEIAAPEASGRASHGVPKLEPFLVFARRHARPSHTLPVKRVLRFRYGSARPTLRCDASSAGRSVSRFKQTLHRGSGCARELNLAAGLERSS
jgi:hypothetical protein